MPAEDKKEIELEIAHVLFVDIVGYSKLSVNDQHARVEELNDLVRASEEFRKAESAGRLLKSRLGTGWRWFFTRVPKSRRSVAVEISRALKEHARLQVRMGIHSGPVSGVADVTERTNVAGAGINMAQRVMNCGDAGHVCFPSTLPKISRNTSTGAPLLHDLGTCEVKHGLRISITNLYDSEIGNSQLPKKLQVVKRHRTHVRWAEVAIALLVLAAIVAGFIFLLRRPTRLVMAIVEKKASRCFHSKTGAKIKPTLTLPMASRTRFSPAYRR